MLAPGMVPGAESVTDIYIYTLAQIRLLHCKISSLTLRHSARQLHDIQYCVLQFACKLNGQEVAHRACPQDMYREELEADERPNI